MMGHREKLKSGDEYDGLTRAKRHYGWNPGVRKQIKRGFNKRVRREVRDWLDIEQPNFACREPISV